MNEPILRPSAKLPRVCLYRDPIDFRKSFRGLALLVEQELKQRIETLKSYLRLARSQMYGRSSEKSEGQWDIFNEMDTPLMRKRQTLTLMSLTHALTRKSESLCQRTLPRHQVFAKLTEEEKKGALTTFFRNLPFRKSREEQDIIPPVVRVLE